MIVRQCLLKRVPTSGDDAPETVCRPFDAKATGAVFGEGAGVVVLENLEHARRRGAAIKAELVGLGQSQGLSAVYDRLEPDGKGIQIAIEKAVADAEISASDLDVIVPHGTGVPTDDQAEARAIEAALGSAVSDVCVWPTKSMLSTTGAASGALDLIAAIRAMAEGTIPAARNFETPTDGCRLRIQPQEQQRDIRYALCCSYTHGGQTAAVVVRRFDESEAG
jgi:3-oxoacyl-(acyl-carrier-protein) synthase